MQKHKPATRDSIAGAKPARGTTSIRPFELSGRVSSIAHALLLCALFFAFTSRAAVADPVLTVDDATGNLGLVDVATGHVTVIGNTGIILTDIAYDPSGNLFGISFTDLYRINPQTAALTRIGATGIPGGNALVFGADGTLYAAGNSSTALFTVNVTTGAATSIGTIGVASAGDLAFNDGNFFFAAATGELIKIDLSHGAAGTVVGPFGVLNVFGLATGSDGILYATAGTFVYSVNTTTGAATSRLNYFGSGLGVANGAAFFTEAGAPSGTPSVPEPSTFLLFATGITATAFIVFVRHRPRHAEECFEP